jgi:hypothetical protein
VTVTDREKFEPLELDTDLTPIDVDRLLRRIHNAVGFANRDLRQLRDAEVQAEKAYRMARTPLMMRDDCPEPNRSKGITKTDRDEWINDRIPDEYWAWREAKVLRQEAEDYFWSLKEQVKCLQSINTIVRQLYDLSGRHG